MAIKLFLIRHGQTYWNEEGRYQGMQDTMLTKAGISQAEAASRYLQNTDFLNIYSSPLKRALDTAEILNRGKKLEIIIRENLAEMNFGKWEGLKFSEINALYHDDYQNWLNDPYNNPPTGGESFLSLTKRASSELGRIIKENCRDGNVAIVTHGGIIVSLLVSWLKIPPDRWRSIIQRQGAINVVVIDRDFPYISAINFTGHLSNRYDENEDKVIKIYSKLKEKDNDN